METRSFDPEDDLEVVSKMLAKGRRAATFDGIHMIIWGGLGALALMLQYSVEVKDWLPNSIVWLWQPAFLIGIVITLFAGQTSLVNRLRNPIARIYSAAFGAACLSLFVYSVSGLSSGRPDAYTFSVLLCVSLASAFFVMGIATHLRQLLVASAGWWMGTAYFAIKGMVTPIDFIVLSGLLMICVVIPGVYLTVRRSVLERTSAADR